MSEIMGKYVTAKLTGADDCRQGVVISVDPLRIRCGCGEEFACDGAPTVVAEQPEVCIGCDLPLGRMCDRCRSNLVALGEILEREGLTLTPA